MQSPWLVNGEQSARVCVRQPPFLQSAALVGTLGVLFEGKQTLFEENVSDPAAAGFLMKNDATTGTANAVPTTYFFTKSRRSTLTRLSTSRSSFSSDIRRLPSSDGQTRRLTLTPSRTGCSGSSAS